MARAVIFEPKDQCDAFTVNVIIRQLTFMIAVGIATVASHTLLDTDYGLLNGAQSDRPTH